MNDAEKRAYMRGYFKGLERAKTDGLRLIREDGSASDVAVKLWKPGIEALTGWLDKIISQRFMVDTDLPEPEPAPDTTQP